ncbi:MAG: hypothetical protein LQ348_004942 [Seirophora lacunosa]|nr:MAG: hypothetical protein LQ344_000178 [Seirophora lacunosa]KAI4181883.1 MAG: hypothetical protein LQ348_004942 [Seirophora lacunosa]
MSDVTKSKAEPTDGRSDEREQTKAESGLEHSSRVDLPSIELPEEVEGNDTFEAEQPPPLPPRPGRANLLRRTSSVAPAAFPSTQASARPRLQATATTAVSRTDIHTQSFQDGSRETSTTSTQRSPSTRAWTGWGSTRRLKIHDGDESASIRSYAPTQEAAGDAESLLGDVLGSEQTSGWNILSKQLEGTVFQLADAPDDEEILHDFDHEFDEVDSLDSSADNEEELLNQWKSKRKHFLILSSAGKPIYNRHGDDNLISGYIGVVQTIISFYESAGDQLKGFTAGGARFVVMAQGPLYLVAISKLGESDSQLRVQLEALYMQILSTLTLPNLTHLFSNRPSTDLRRPLQGTEPLLSALADSFTRGSVPTLFSALECLKIRKSHREVINNTLLLKRCESLLYGLVVAGGRLVSVVRPRRHSLHPSDLRLIFNMLFEAEGVKAGGGENWIPLCLPGFNKNGYLYMYVSFIDQHEDENQKENREESSATSRQDEVTVLLISANKESFYDLRQMRDDVVEELEKNGSMGIIRRAISRGRYVATDIVPGTVLQHFIYKSRANVQFTMPSYDPYYPSLLARRRLLSLYHNLHAVVHARNAHLKVHHCISRDAVSLAWVTPLFELYCVAGPNANRNALAHNANKVVQWAHREEERIFIIGGAVF